MVARTLAPALLLITGVWLAQPAPALSLPPGSQPAGRLARLPRVEPAIRQPFTQPPPMIQTASHAELSSAYQQLLARLEFMERRLAEQDAKAKPSGESTKQTAKKAASDDEGWTHSVGGRALVETVMWTDDAGIGQNYTQIRQVRLAVRGKGYGVYDYRVQMEFEPEAIFRDGTGTERQFGSLAMKDVYVGMHEIPLFGYVRTGHFKVPFSHDQMLSRRDMTFMERTPMAEPNGFTPGREVGIAAFNYSADENFTWGYGAFFDSISEQTMQRVDDNQGLVLGSRLTWTPVYDEPSEGRYIVHLGLGLLYTDPWDDSGRFRQRPEIHEGPVFIDTGPIASNQYLSINTELLVHWGPVYVNSEAWATNVNDPSGRTDLYSAYVEAGWFLTGEHRSYNRREGVFGPLDARRNFRLGRGGHGPGAWEVAARWSYVDFSQSPFASRYNSLNLALNWYLNPGTRVQMNYVLPYIEGLPWNDLNAGFLSLRLAGYF